MPLTEVYKRVKEGVVLILSFLDNNIVSNGTGSVINKGKHVLTCAHCIIEGTKTCIKIEDRIIEGQVIFKDSEKDVAIIEFDEVIGAPIELISSDNVEIGNGSFLVGYPMRIFEQTLASSYIASISNNFIRIDASVNHGNSGGPLFNLKGQQIGIINAKHGNLSQLLIDIKEAKADIPVFVGGHNGFNPVTAIQRLLMEMQSNLNLGIGYAISTSSIKVLHEILNECI